LKKSAEEAATAIRNRLKATWSATIQPKI
jgi:hypothetical protein